MIHECSSMQQVDVQECVELQQSNMGHVCVRRWASSSAVVLLHTLTLSWTGEARVLHLLLHLRTTAQTKEEHEV